MHAVSVDIVPGIAAPGELQVLVAISAVKLVVYVARSTRGMAWVAAKKAGRRSSCCWESQREAKMKGIEEWSTILANMVAGDRWFLCDETKVR